MVAHAIVGSQLWTVRPEPQSTRNDEVRESIETCRGEAVFDRHRRAALDLLGFSSEDRIVLIFCGSKKSLATGVPLAGVLFTQAQVGAVILPLMFFHQIQLVVCAVLARRFARARRRPSSA